MHRPSDFGRICRGKTSTTWIVSSRSQRRFWPWRHKLVREADGAPLLNSKSADGTPITVSHRHANAPMQDSSALSHGETASAIFQTCLRDWRSLRQMGHAGCAIEHCCHGHCGIDAPERFWRQWHSSQAPSFDALAVDPPGLFPQDRICWCHTVRGSQCSDLLRDAFVAVQSLRNSINLLCDCPVHHLELFFTRRFGGLGEHHV